MLTGVYQQDSSSKQPRAHALITTLAASPVISTDSSQPLDSISQATRMKAHFAAVTLFLASGCSSDAERQATLQKYGDPPPATQATTRGCDKAAAQRVKAMFSTPEMGHEGQADGWIVMTFGSDYSVWTTEQRHQMVTTFADADTCLSGSARKIEFNTPGGKTIARADRVRGIRFLDK